MVEKIKFAIKIFQNEIYLTILHGQKDDVVPVIISRKIMKIFKKAKKKIISYKKWRSQLV